MWKGFQGSVHSQDQAVRQINNKRNYKVLIYAFIIKSPWKKNNLKIDVFCIFELEVLKLEISNL